MLPLVKQLASIYPDIAFRAGSKFYWSPETNEVVYNRRLNSLQAQWALLHETSHALLNHKTYHNDFQLVEMEMSAWERAKQLASELNMTEIDENHIQDCLDTYRDWLHQRCLCPTCKTRCLQTTSTLYQCHNCGSEWRVSASRFCRAYRLNLPLTSRIA